MEFFLIALSILIAVGAKIFVPGRFNTEYMEKRHTTAINGIFVILVIFSHYAQYANFDGTYDVAYIVLRKHLGQMVVAMFLFYSGYGMMEAYRCKGSDYVRRVLVKFWQLLLRFDIVVLLFLLMDCALGIEYPRNQILIAFTSWTNIGNSNWYITAILILYILFSFSFTIGSNVSDDRKGRITGLLLLFILTIVNVYVQMKIDRPAYCYNTMILLPLGCLYSEFKPEIEHLVMKNDIIYLTALTLILAVYVVSFRKKDDLGIEGYTVWAIAFTFLVVLITMKVAVYNKYLAWIGKHIFSIYMLQRIPMIILSNTGFIETHKYVGLIIVIIVTFLIAPIFDKITNEVIVKIINSNGAKELNKST